MKRMVELLADLPRWLVLLAGVIFGAGVALSLSKGERIDHAAIWSAALGMQGWIGSVVGAILGALGAFGASVFVLQRTLADEQRRFERQRSDSKAQFRAQMRQERKQAQEAATQQRKLDIEQRRIEVWSQLVATAREYFAYPLKTEEGVAVDSRMTAVVLQWELYIGSDDQEIADGVRAVVSEIVASTKGAVIREREANSELPAPLRTSRVRCPKDDLIVDLGRKGLALHRVDASEQMAAAEWFKARGRDHAKSAGG